MRSAALILDQVANGGAVRESGRLRGTSPFVGGGCEVTTCNEFGQALCARPAAHSDHACDRSAVIGDHDFPALPDLREIATEVVFQLSNPNGIYSHILRAIIATSSGEKPIEGESSPGGALFEPPRRPRPIQVSGATIQEKCASL